MFSRLILPFGVLIVGGAIISMLVVAKPTPTPAPEAEEPSKIQVSVVPLLMQDLQISVTSSSTVEAKVEIDLVAQVSGQIMKVEPNFTEGGFFDKDQVLLKIDDTQYQAALLAAKAKVADSKRLLAEERGRSRQAKREWRDLGNQNANNLFLRKPQLTSASALLASAQAALEVAKQNLERTQISVPFGGRVKVSYADLGQYVMAGTAIAKVYDSSSVELRLPLTEAQAALIDLPFTYNPERQNPKVRIAGSLAGEAHVWIGELVGTDSFVDSTSRMYFAIVKVDLNDVNQALKGIPLLPGLFVEAEIEGKVLQNIALLPRASLYERDTLLTLNAENKIVRQKVKVLHRNADFVWVKTHLPNETLVSLDKQSLTPEGTEVDPILHNADGSPLKSKLPVKSSVDAATNITEEG